MTWEESERWFASLCVSGLPDDGVAVQDLVKFLEMSADMRELSSWEKEVLGIARWSLQRHDPERSQLPDLGAKWPKNLRLWPGNN